MNFRITGLSAEPFRELYGLSDTELASKGARRYLVDSIPGYPDRIEMRDAELGEHVILVNFVHQPADTPYQASHAIFVREGADRQYDRTGEVPEVMRTRLLSLRAFDASHMMVQADVVEGKNVEEVIERFFADLRTGYIHVHNARQGCYSGRIDRA